MCYEYLRDKNKFSAFRTKCEEDSLGKRPIGKKKARQAEADAKLVKAIISEVIVKKEKIKVGGSDSIVSAYESSGESGGVNSGGALGDVLQNISSVIANVGTAFLENMKAEHDTPDRKCTQRNSWRFDWRKRETRGVVLSSPKGAAVLKSRKKQRKMNERH